MRLTEFAIKHAQPSEKIRKLFDGGGLHLFITPQGGKYWRYRYRHQGKDCTLSLGTYPKITLKNARQCHREAQSLLEQGINPHDEKQRQKRKAGQATSRQLTFEHIAREWYGHQRPQWKNAKHAQQVINTLVQYVFPVIGQLPIDDVPPVAVFNLLAELKDKAETATRVKQRINAVFTFAIQTGRATTNPAQSAPKIIRGAENSVQHHPALPKNELGSFLAKLEGYANRKTALALRLLVLTLTRSGELRYGRWEEIKGD